MWGRTTFIMEEFGGKIEFLSTRNILCRKLQLTVEMLSEIYGVCVRNFEKMMHMSLMFYYGSRARAASAPTTHCAC